jgi:hypothetical protein
VKAMEEHKLREILIHQININIRLQEFMFDMIETIPDLAQRKRSINLLQSISKENKDMLAELLPAKGLLG